MNKEYYKEYYTLERTHWWFRVREKIIEDRVKKNIPNSSLKILNIGIATGKSTEMLNQFGEVTSVEFDKDCCKFLEETLKISVINASITNLPFNDEVYDMVCAFDVIEHVEEDQKAVSEMYRVCKRDGVLFLTVPAFMSLWSQHDEVNHHQRRYVLKDLRWLFRSYKGKVIYKSYFNSILFLPILLFRTLSKIIPAHWVRKGSGSDFNVNNTNSFINKIFFAIFNLERRLLSFIKFPFGVSILYVWKK